MSTQEIAAPVKVAIIGGSGLYEIPGFSQVEAVRLTTPFGETSDEIVVGSFSGVRCAFLSRHGRGHRLLPSEIPSRANICALKMLGVERIIGIGACGSLREELAPRHFVIPDQIYDATKRRESTFFGGGIVAHVSLDQPFCPDMSGLLYETAGAAGLTVHRGGTYVCIEGPAFSTKAESRVHRAQGFDVIGMTAAPEHKLAREAEICYATVSMVTDYDVWKEGEEVTIEGLIGNLMANVENGKKLIAAALPRLSGPRGCRCGSALKNAVFTSESARNPETRERLSFLLDK